MTGPVDAQFKRRVLLLLCTEFVWGLGSFFVLPATTVATFLTVRGAPPVVVGAMATAMGALPLLLQFLGRDVMRRFRSGKLCLLLLHLPFIACCYAIPLLDLLLRDRPRAVVGATIAMLAAAQVVMGLMIAPWLDMLAQVIPLPLRGRYFGLATGAFALGGILGGAGLTALDRSLGAGVYRAAFLTAGILFSLSMGIFAAAPIPEAVFAHPPEPSMWVRCRRSLAACSVRLDFGRLVWSYSAVVLAAAIIPFLTVYAADPTAGLDYPPGFFTRLTLLQAVGGAISSVFLGWMIDRHGPRWPWTAATLVVPAVVLLYPHGQHPAALVVAAMLSGVLTAHWSVSGPALLELSPEGDKSGYVAVANIIAFVPAAVGPLLFGAIIQSAGYTPAFAAAAAAGLLGLVPALAMRGRRSPAGGYQTTADTEGTVEREEDRTTKDT